jgi:glycosyltransferase involved in cell wall biosynthesis
VIANSTSAKNDVVRFYGVAPEKVDVVLLGADEELEPGGESPTPLPAPVREKYGIPAGPFFLFVGKLSKRRNVPLLIEAFASAQSGGALAERLVVVGPDHWAIDPLGAARKAGVADSVIWAAHAPMEDLAHLYRGSTAFVLPTEHEGFSLTIPEAMACGAPAIAFDHAALEGGLREAAMLVEPRTRDGLVEALRAVASDFELRARLRRQSLACAARFRWERTARETMDVLARAAAIDC